METSAPWPINRYGTTWRYAMAFFDWRDEELFDEAIETLDPLKITVRSRPIVVVGPIDVGYISMQQFAEIVQEDDERFCVIDPRPDLDRKCAEIEDEIGDAAWHFVLGLARLDLFDEDTYRALMAAFEDRRGRFRLWSPHIEFWDV